VRTVRVRRGQQVAVVRVLTLDQPGREPGLARLEHRLAGAETHGELGVARQDPLELGERTSRHEHLLARCQHRRLRQIAHREPVRVGGDHLEAVVLGGHQHTGEHGPGVVGRRRPHHLAQRVGHLRSAA
jgi:hypothetical protein